MPLTLGLSGLDPATDSALQSAFRAANTRLGGHWRLVPEESADYVIVDMDTMYGPMNWLRLHGAGKTVIALTVSMRTQTDYLLNRPFDAMALAKVLTEIAVRTGVPQPAAAPRPAAPAPAASAPPPHPPHAPAPAAPSVAPAAPRTAVAPPPAPPVAPPLPPPAPRVAASASPASAPPVMAMPPIPRTAVPPPMAPVAPTAPPQRVPPPAPQTPEARPAAPPPAAAAVPPPPRPIAASLVAPATPQAPAGAPLLDWLVSGHLNGRLRLQVGADPLLIDADERIYHGPTALRPIIPYFERRCVPTDFQRVDAAAWAAETQPLGKAMPLARLVWFGSLLAGHGSVIGGDHPSRRYRMLKWPQVEREYPKHFRIATVMMRAPSTLAEIAEHSGLPPGDIADFINASLATGFAEIDGDPGNRPGGLFDRLRGR